MFVVKNYVTTGGTVVCALAIGYLMQYGTPAQQDDAQGTVAVAATDQASVFAGLEGVMLTSASPSDTSASKPTVQKRTLQSSPSTSRPTTTCALSARATRVAGANARLRVKAPCKANQRVEIHHSGLTLTQKTDDAGSLDLTIPALSEYAIFLISFEDHTGTVATTHVPEITRFDRVALQWSGDTALQIHALEFGANYGGEGHVWADVSSQGKGSVVHLGHSGFGDAQNIEIYSFPAGQSAQSGTIDLTVEAEVTEANCGRDLNVQSIELRGNGQPRSRDLTLNLPACSQAGEFLVLNNLLEDLTIAAK